MLITPAYAQAAAGGGDASSMLVQLAPLALIFVVFYFFLIRPQQQKARQQRSMLDAIRRVHAGDTLLPPQLTAKLAQRVTDDSLTDREREVLTLVAEGRSNREIGSEIHIEESTVKTHLKSIFAKTGASRQADLVKLAAAFSN